MWREPGGRVRFDGRHVRVAKFVVSPLVHDRRVAIAVFELDERVTRGEIGAAARALGRLVARLDLDVMAPVEAPELWAEFDQVERLAANAKIVLARKVEASNVWKREGFRSAAQYLAHGAGITTSAARQTLETSKQVESLPAVRQAMQRGDVSAVQVAAIADAANADPSAEVRLLDVARRTNVRELREECLRVKAAADPNPEATQRRIHARRSLRTYVDQEGAWHAHLRGTIAAGAKLQAALEPIIDELYKQARAADRRESREAYGFDAVMRLAEGEPSPKSARVTPRYLGLLRVDWLALLRGWQEGEEVCEIAGLGPVPVSTAREILGESILKLVITKGVDVANVVHLGRGPTAAQRIALLWQAPKCTNEACSSMFVQHDHREPWAKTKRTVLHELDPLCLHCHWLKTDANWALVTGKGRRAFVPPNDPRHPMNKPPP
jgi:hypothetical protein